MEATITTIGNIIKKKVDDSVVDFYDAPTIWLDSLTGEEHEDYEHKNIKSKDPHSKWWEGDADSSFYIEHGNYNGGREDVMVVNGPIKQVGSHVISCGIISGSDEPYPFLDRLDRLFRYARNLEYLDSTFFKLETGDQELRLPEDLFWHCPKINELYDVFNGSNLKVIPSGLLTKCLNLKHVTKTFRNTKVSEIPEDLFKNNLNIKTLNSTFAGTRVKKIPDNLLIQFKDDIESEKISVDAFVSRTPIEKAFKKTSGPKMLEERKAKRALYFPKYLTKPTCWRMLDIFSDEAYIDF